MHSCALLCGGLAMVCLSVVTKDNFAASKETGDEGQEHGPHPPGPRVGA